MIKEVCYYLDYVLFVGLIQCSCPQKEECWYVRIMGEGGVMMEAEAGVNFKYEERGTSQKGAEAERARCWLLLSASGGVSLADTLALA